MDSFPYAFRRALVDALTEAPGNTLSYDALRTSVLAKVRADSGLESIPFDKLLDDATQRCVLDWAEPGLIQLKKQAA